MLTIARTRETLNPKPERETVTFRLNYGGGKTELLTIPANPRERSEPVPEPGSAFYFTTAPEAYDGFGTKTIEANAGKASNGKQWRKVQILDRHFEWQNGRNGSGFHPTVPALQFEELRHVFIPPEPEPVSFLVPVNVYDSRNATEPAGFVPPGFVDFTTADGSAWRTNSGNLNTVGILATVCAPLDRHELETRVNANRKPVEPRNPVIVSHVGDTTAKRQQDETAVAELVDNARAKRQAEEKQLTAFRAFDWTTNPKKWKPEFVLYYLETVCGENVSHESRTGTDAINAENLARAEFQYRNRNTTTATTTVNRRALVECLRTAKKLGGTRGVNKTVALSVNGALELVAITPDARFSQTVSFREKSGHNVLTVPEVRLLEICNKLKPESIELVLSALPALGEYTLTVKTDSAEFKIPVDQDSANNAFTSEFPAEFAHDINAEELLNAFKITEFATDTESTRYALGGLMIVPKPDSLEIVATDSRRLSWKEVPAELRGTLPELEKGKTLGSLGAVVPAGIISILSDELKRRPAGVVSFARAVVVCDRAELKPPEQPATKNRTKTKPVEWKPNPPTEHNKRNVQDADGRWFCETIRLEYVFEMQGAFSLRGVAVDGRFPRYTDVIPRSFNHVFDFDRAELLNACETAILSTDEESRGVDFEFPKRTETARGSVLRLLASSANQGKATVSVQCRNAETYAEESTVVTLDPKYILDYLKRLPADSVRFSIVDAETAVLMTAEPDKYKANGNAGYLIMPLAQDR